MAESNELVVCFAFNSYYIRTLKNEAINAHQSMNRRKEHILNFSDLSVDEEYILINHEYIDVIPEYYINGSTISVEQLKNGIEILPEHEREIINLYYFEGLNDRKISEITQVPKSTVQNWRVTALARLKRDLEKYANDWSEL